MMHQYKRERAVWMRALVGLWLCALMSLIGLLPGLTQPVAWANESESGESSDTSVHTEDANTQRTYDFVISDDAGALSSSNPAFSITGYTLLPVGSTRPVAGIDAGLTFSVGDTAPTLMILTVDGYTLVYVDASLTLDSQALRAGIAKLDSAQSQHITPLGEDVTWEFTSDRSFAWERAGVQVDFGRELVDGHYYVCVEPLGGAAGAGARAVADADARADADAAGAASSQESAGLSTSTSAAGVEGTSSDATALTPVTSLRFGMLSVGSGAQVVHASGPIERMVDFLATIDYSPLWVTLKTTFTAIVIVFILGLLAAYFSLHVSPRVRDIADSIFTIPMVLPPTVCGFVLLLALGRNTAVGLWFINIGFPLIFSWAATVIAAVVVAFPLMYRSARGAFESIDPLLLDAARTLGWSEPRIFFKLMLPLAWTSIASGTVLAFARALGEFGATLFLAGNYLGITRTIPIAIYFEWMNGNTDVAIFWTLVIIVVSFIVILFINLYGRRTQRFRMKGPRA